MQNKRRQILKIGSGAFCVFAQAHTVPATTLMITSHLNSSLKIPRKGIIIAQPIITGCMAIAMFYGADISIISSFCTVVGLLFAPLLGIIFAEYYVVGKRSFRQETETPHISPAGIITLIVGFLLGAWMNYFADIPLPTAMILLPLCFVLQIVLRMKLHLS